MLACGHEVLAQGRLGGSQLHSVCLCLCIRLALAIMHATVTPSAYVHICLLRSSAVYCCLHAVMTYHPALQLDLMHVAGILTNVATGTFTSLTGVNIALWYSAWASGFSMPTPCDSNVILQPGVPYSSSKCTSGSGSPAFTSGTSFSFVSMHHHACLNRMSLRFAFTQYWGYGPTACACHLIVRKKNAKMCDVSDSLTAC